MTKYCHLTPSNADNLVFSFVKAYSGMKTWGVKGKGEEKRRKILPCFQ